jgi:ATP-dependent RNA helicase HelY
VEQLDAAGLLPAIFFVFSRAGCDAAVWQVVSTGVRLSSAEEQTAIRGIVEERCAGIPDEDLHVLGYHDWAEALTRGVAAHHAGMLPTFKEVVEELFTAGLVKVVFATETLALGINMPARTVVLEKLTKWNGEQHADVTPAEYTQLTGRAGRRGIDVEGHGVVLWQPGLDPKAVAGLASTRTYPLRSSFRPSYNMAVNLVRQVGRSAARELLESSFAQFQADRAVVGLAQQLRRVEESLAGYSQSVACHLGDFWEYAALRRRLRDREAAQSRQRRTERRSEVVGALRRLSPGDVIEVPAGRWAGLAVVVDPGVAADGDGPRPFVVTAGRQARRLSLVDFPVPVEPMLRMRVPRTFNARNPQQRRDLASALRQKTAGLAPDQRRGGLAVADDEHVRRLRAAIRTHPCHRCADREDHARWAGSSPARTRSRDCSTACVRCWRSSTTSTATP